MPDQNSDKDREIPADNQPVTDESLPAAVPAGMTLEAIIDCTGELEHLNELVMLKLDKTGGFTCTESYFSIVQPVLDLLEVEIRLRYYHGMTEQEMKLLVQDWIDKEIADARKTGE
jgi:hypothetical protein